MTIKSSGSLSLSEINAEFGLGTNLGAYRGVTWYTDAGASGTFPSTNISIGLFYSKRKTAPGALTGSPYTGSELGDLWTQLPAPQPPSITLTFLPNGIWSATALLSGINYSDNWFFPTTTNIGSSYAIRFTKTGEKGFIGTSSASTGWLSLSSARSISATRIGTGAGYYWATYTIDIGTAGGSVLVSSSITLSAEVTG